MKKYGLVCLIFLLSILFISCETDEINNNELFTIEFGTECGWCAGQEYIIVSKSEVNYNRTIPCGDKQGTTQKKRTFDSAEWDELISSFDYSLFLTLDLNECNVCADGCDEIIKITKPESTHEIRYSPAAELPGMDNFQDILKQIVEEFRKEN